MSFKVGENVGPYRIIEQLGQGGMATVFKAYHASLDRYVAVKALHQAFNEDSTFTARFQREARVVAKLEHPNIVPVYDYSEHESRPYLVMKFIEGDTLKARFQRGALNSQEIEQVVTSVGSALGYAHQQGVLHRDIKPSNVLLSNEGIMYLADFGLARIAQAGESTLSSDSIMGTPQYISPEQAMGKKDLDSGTDIYSFGVMLYEMVVGQVPFSADTPFSIIHDHIYTPLPLPMDINPKVPEPVQKVLLKALAKDRADRYKTVEDLVYAFKSAWTEAGVPMQGTAITMRPTSLKRDTKIQDKATAQRIEASQPVVKKRSLSWMWVSLVLMLIVCVGVGLGAFVNRNGLIRRWFAQPTIVVVNSPVPVIPTLPPVTTEPNISPAIVAAQELVKQNPADPNAHLQLSLAFYDDGQPVRAAEALAQAANLAGANNKDFFANASRQYRDREAWVLAAGMDLRLAQAYRAEGEIPNDVIASLRESVYKASEQKEMPLFVFFERIDAVDLPLGYIARGRYALFNGSLEDAKTNVFAAEKIKPDLYEIPLLKSEIAIKLNDINTSKSLLNALSSDLGAAAWIRNFANELLKTIP
jgi:serine/threonine protein kinase